MINTTAQNINSGNRGLCEIALEVQRVFRQANDFYNRCPINDPNGGMRQYSKEMIEWGRETQSASCVR